MAETKKKKKKFRKKGRPRRCAMVAVAGRLVLVSTNVFDLELQAIQVPESIDLRQADDFHLARQR